MIIRFSRVMIRRQKRTFLNSTDDRETFDEKIRGRGDWHLRPGVCGDGGHYRQRCFRRHNLACRDRLDVRVGGDGHDLCAGRRFGAHLNPAVTLGFWAAGRFERKHVLPYLFAQLVGAFAASGVLRVLFLDHRTLGATLPAGPWWQAFVFEVLLTFLLMFVILNVSTGAKEKGIMAGAAIGGVVRSKRCSPGRFAERP